MTESCACRSGKVRTEHTLVRACRHSAEVRAGYSGCRLSAAHTSPPHLLRRCHGACLALGRDHLLIQSWLQLQPGMLFKILQCQLSCKHSFEELHPSSVRCCTRRKSHVLTSPACSQLATRQQKNLVCTACEQAAYQTCMRD